MTERFEAEIRRALDERAYEVDVPDDLATRTVASAAVAPVRPPLWARVRAWRDARRMKLPVTGYPRWLLAPAAVTAALVLFGVGTFVSMDRPQRDDMERRAAAPAREPVADRDGQAGVVSGGDASADATNRANTSEDVDVETGDASGDESASAFIGLTAGPDTPVRAQDVLDPQLVRSADIRVAVGDFEDAWEEANEIAPTHDGVVIDLRTSQVADEIAEGTIRMRVPTSNLDAVLKDLRGLGTVAQLETTGEDISKQIADVKEKVSDSEDEEAELKDLEARASTISERLAVQRRLEEVRKDIENLEDKQKSYEDQVELSIVNATIFEDEVAAGKGASILSNAVRTSVRLALTILAGTLVVAGALAPLALLALAIWFAVRTIRKRRAG